MRTCRTPGEGQHALRQAKPVHACRKPTEDPLRRTWTPHVTSRQTLIFDAHEHAVGEQRPARACDRRVPRPAGTPHARPRGDPGGAGRGGAGQRRRARVRQCELPARSRGLLRVPQPAARHSGRGTADRRAPTSCPLAPQAWTQCSSRTGTPGCSSRTILVTTTRACSTWNGSSSSSSTSDERPRRTYPVGLRSIARSIAGTTIPTTVAASISTKWSQRRRWVRPLVWSGRVRSCPSLLVRAHALHHGGVHPARVPGVERWLWVVLDEHLCGPRRHVVDEKLDEP
jgi:hypothetical protein